MLIFFSDFAITRWILKFGGCDKFRVTMNVQKYLSESFDMVKTSHYDMFGSLFEICLVEMCLDPDQVNTYMSDREVSKFV